MKLVFDLGNSRCKWALANASLTPGGAFAYGDNFAHALDQTFGSLSRPDQVAAVSVAGAERTSTLAHWVRRRWNLDLIRFSACAAQCGVTNTYKDPAQLGADRWAALIAARARVLDAVCVVDGGTAITVDALDRNGVFRGGVIFPGVALMLSSLLQGTHGIQVSVGNHDSCLAQSTSDAVAAGVHYSLAGAIDRILDEQAAELGCAIQCLLTGGNADVLSSLIRHPMTIVPDLVLEGVARMACAGDVA
jgi:type III pantothenate kinase